MILSSVVFGLQIQAAAANDMVHKRVLEIVDAGERPLRFTGVSTGGWFMWEGWIFGKGLFLTESKIISGIGKLIGASNLFRDEVYDNFFTDADFSMISSLGFNLVRIPFNHRLLEDDEKPFVYKADGWRRLDDALTCCERHNMYAILDLHSVPGGQSNVMVADPDSRKELVWNSPENQRRTVELWRAIAERYRGRRIIAGYDLINEPLVQDGNDLVSLYERIIAAVRSVDPDHMIILEGGKMATDFSMFKHSLDPNQIYSFHMYTWFGDNRMQRLKQYRSIATQQQVPFWCGEFGENSYAMIESTVALFRESPWMVGQCFWTWKRAPSKSPGLAVYSVPPDWMKSLEWIIWPVKAKPSKEAVETSIEQFLQAVQLKNCHVDRHMAEILVRPTP